MSKQWASRLSLRLPLTCRLRGEIYDSPLIDVGQKDESRITRAQLSGRRGQWN